VSIEEGFRVFADSAPRTRKGYKILYLRGKLLPLTILKHLKILAEEVEKAGELEKKSIILDEDSPVYKYLNQLSMPIEQMLMYFSQNLFNAPRSHLWYAVNAYYGNDHVAGLCS
jgi:hypothetical protein